MGKATDPVRRSRQVPLKQLGGLLRLVVGKAAMQVLQHLTEVPLDRRLLDPPEVTEQAVHVRHKPARLLAADLLEGVTDSYADDLVR